MRIDQLKCGFWGYKKDSVYKYIVSQEEKASGQLAEKEARLEKQTAEHKKQIAELETEYQKQVAELEAAMTALQGENAFLRENQASVFATMLEAQKYAEQLRLDSDQRRQQEQEKLSATVQQKNRQVDGYLEQIRQLRTLIVELLKDFDGKVEEMECALARLPLRAPDTRLEEASVDISGVNETPPASKSEKLPPKLDKGEKDKWKKISYT